MFEYEFNLDDNSDNSQDKKILKIISEGKCFFIINNTHVGPSKSSGRMQLAVTLKVTDDYGTTNAVWCYFPSVMNKVTEEIFKSFLAGCGMAHLFGTKFDEKELEGCTGTCMIKHQSSPEYGTQPKVKFFFDKTEPGKSFKPHHVNQAKANGLVESELDDGIDDIPF